MVTVKEVGEGKRKEGEEMMVELIVTIVAVGDKEDGVRKVD